jgi:hypothetical protein
MHTSKYTVFSLGYRCTSAGLLKKLNLKNESYPFDWLISRLHVVKHCIENRFSEFLKLENYKHLNTKTFDSYNDQPILVCEEKIIFNTFYTPENIVNNCDINTYNYHLALNHKSLFNTEDFSYYERCIERFNKLLVSNHPKMFVYVHKMLCKNEYDENKDDIINEFLEFNNFMKSHTDNIIGTFFIIVKDDIDFCKLEKTNCLEKSHNIYTLYTTKRLMDTGEILMGDYWNEEQCLLNELTKLIIQ